MTAQHNTATERSITTGQSTTEAVSPDTATPIHTWLTAQANKHQLQWLLLHADSGVVWGERRGQELVLSGISAAVDWKTLHQARLFGEAGELFVWQGPQGWRARLIRDTGGSAVEWIDEQQLLWGDRVAPETNGSNGFAPLVEGSQGIVHAPPIGDKLPIRRKTNEKQLESDRARLLVRHYVSEDDAGVARVSHSRLVKLLKPGEE